MVRAIIAVVMFGILSMVPVWGQVVPESERGSDETSRKGGRSDRVEERQREEACDCCMKCMAATRETLSKEEGPPARNGCKDCCRRCGTTDLPTKRKMPPEIVQ